MKICILGLSITSSWGNGHATTYRALVRGLAQRAHEVTFLERDVPWYASQRDLPQPRSCKTILYSSLDDLRTHAPAVADADLVIVGSYVPQGIDVAAWVFETAQGITAFYDIDTPVTLAKLSRGEEEYLAARHIPRFDLYLSFTGGPILERLDLEYGAQRARPLYCAVDERLYAPAAERVQWDLGYLGTYSADRQPPLDRLLLYPARFGRGRFVVAGPQYPPEITWPENVARIDHLPPAEHRAFYNAQRFTLNVTRADMVCAGFAPSVRLFEAAACGTPIISDWWEGLDTFFTPGQEILIAQSPEDTLRFLWDIPEAQARAIGEAGRARVLQAHTAGRRAEDLERLVRELMPVN